MGWWGTTREGVSFTTDEQGYVWGDGPADTLDDALHKIVEEFERSWGRKPRLGELRAGLEFSLLSGDDDEVYGEP